MVDDCLQALLDPTRRTVEIESGRFAYYAGSGRWETYLKSRRGARTGDGPLMTTDIRGRFLPGSPTDEQVERIIALVDG